jgi:hypothetical protein
MGVLDCVKRLFRVRERAEIEAGCKPSNEWQRLAFSRLGRCL